MIHHFIRAQPNPEDPSGTIITVSSGRAGLTIPGGSSYNIAKLAAQRLTEHVHLGMYSTLSLCRLLSRPLISAVRLCQSSIRY